MKFNKDNTYFNLDFLIKHTKIKGSNQIKPKTASFTYETIYKQDMQQQNNKLKDKNQPK